jgi:hypothetical protein
VHNESSVTVAVQRAQFGNTGEGGWYPRTSEGQQTKRTQCVCYSGL